MAKVLCQQHCFGPSDAHVAFWVPGVVHTSDTCYRCMFSQALESMGAAPTHALCDINYFTQTCEALNVLCSRLHNAIAGNH